MVKVDPSAHRVVQWLGLPASALALVFVFSGAFVLASWMMVAIAGTVVLAMIVNRFANTPRIVFARIKEDTLVLTPLSYFRPRPIQVPIAKIHGIRERGESGNRKFQIQYASGRVEIDLKRMLGVSYKRTTEEEFLNFLRSEIMDVEHVFDF